MKFKTGNQEISNKTKSWLFKNINKIYKTLAMLTKKSSENTQFVLLEMKKGPSLLIPCTIENIIKGY